ncbi:MAG: hypothetical protein ABWY20_08605 [Mycobacterium sp.]
MTTSGPDPYGDFSFEEVGGEVPPAPSATASDPVPDEGRTEYEIESSSATGGYSDEATDSEGMTPLGAGFNREGK